MRKASIAPIAGWLAAVTLIGGCTVHPPGEQAERDTARGEGRPFEKRLVVRPPLPSNPTLEQLVDYALLNNASLEESYWTWRAAIEQIPQDGTQTASVNLAAGAMINGGRSSWDSTTLALSNDPMTDIKTPSKLGAAARQALEDARAAGHRFFNAKYELRGKVLYAWYDYALDAELIRLEENNEQLLQTVASSTAARSRVGSGGQEVVLKAANELDLARNDLATLQAQLLSRRATINALLGMPPDTKLPIPATIPVKRAALPDDGQLIGMAAKANPELRALADQIRGRENGLALARLQYVPDFNLSIGTDLAGSVQSLLGQVTIPAFRHEAIDAAVEQAEAKLRAAEAARRESANALAARVIAAIVVLRDADRQLTLLQEQILPRIKQIVSIGRTSYVTGRSSLLDYLDEQRSLIAIERLVANLHAAREKALVDLETVGATSMIGSGEEATGDGGH
ncbi:MAG: outer rane efflux protein [Phycisphaerales bacterium]|nr:outer rane efflux protein [Phycisphaerales bacterium]